MLCVVTYVYGYKYSEEPPELVFLEVDQDQYDELEVWVRDMMGFKSPFFYPQLYIQKVEPSPFDKASTTFNLWIHDTLKFLNKNKKKHILVKLHQSARDIYLQIAKILGTTPVEVSIDGDDDDDTF